MVSVSPTPSFSLFAEVAVARPLRQTYTYGVPDELAATLRVGNMVRIPFQRQSVEGVVMSLMTTTDVPVKKLKPIETILTPEYALPSDLLDLSRWMSDYYLAGIGEALSTISFFGLRDFKPSVERRLALNEMSRPDIKLTKRQEMLTLFFEENGNRPMTRAEITEEFKCSVAIINTLLEKCVLAETTSELDGLSPGRVPKAASAPHTLQSQQQAAFEKIATAVTEKRYEAFLLQGITGSGKTEVYLQAIARALEEGRQAIVLVPEIALTPQAVDRFRRRFGPSVGVYHSSVTARQKYELWRQIASGRIQVLIGARSAIFAPFPNLGLLVVDEEHEGTYKQSDPAPRYHARDLALWRGRQLSIPVVLGSATPSLESIRNAQLGKYTLLPLTERVGGACLPDIRLIDMSELVLQDRETDLLSPQLQEAIHLRMERKEHTILFLNRRGFSNFFLCMACKTSIRCSHCDTVLTWHKVGNKLLCHICGETRPRPTVCPECGAPEPTALGAGTQRIEEELARIFPEARVLRVDYDSAGGGTFVNLWDRIEGGDYDILLGTQMIAKGLHLENVTLVGVISVDHALFLPDFRAAERTFSMITQVAGRAGRMKQRGEVFLQTFMPNHYAIQRAVAHDSEGFYQREIHMREMLRFPPCQRLLMLRLSSKDDKKLLERAHRLIHILRDTAARGNTYRTVSIFGPTPSPISKIKDDYRWQIVLRCESPALMRGLLFEALAIYEKDKGKSAVNITLDMDPVDML
ncbi:TPA: primosomal protein N' [Candidatus Sumerlaeota bacterium]|jgi:primosomal protein N' (replication factor Y) (superfamily II helicase)|nr:primosomal protein N' [Candidatus Sumerlaeota bacterium]